MTPNRARGFGVYCGGSIGNSTRLVKLIAIVCTCLNQDFVCRKRPDELKFRRGRAGSRKPSHHQPHSCRIDRATWPLISRRLSGKRLHGIDRDQNEDVDNIVLKAGQIDLPSVGKEIHAHSL